MRQTIYKFQNVCDTITDYVANGSFKSLANNVNYSNHKDYARLIRLVDFNNNYDETSAVWVSRASYEYLKKTILYGDEIIISNVGANVGTVFKCPKLTYNMTLGPNSILVKTNEICNQDYLYYYLKSKVGYNKLITLVSGSAMPKFNKTDLRNLEISLPNRKYQDKAVKLLIVIDNKIKLNNQINDNLYEIALSLLDEDFKNSTVFNKLSESIKFIKGKKPKNIEAKKIDGYEKYLTIACLNNQEMNYADIERMIMCDNDILMVMDGASSGESYYYNHYGIVGSTLSKIEVVTDKLNNKYVYFVLKKYEDLIKSKNTGSAIPHTDKVFVGSLEIPIIDEKKQFLYSVILDKISKLQDENKVLEQLRDTLLPKLMNGEIDLENVEI